jgi:hypothetical protein
MFYWIEVRKMNKNVAKLFVKAGGCIEGNLTYTDEGFDPELFAELIIRNCAHVCLEANDYERILNLFEVGVEV